MDWTQIIVGVLTLLGGDALIRILLLKQEKKNKEAEAKGKEKENDATEVATLKEAIEQMGKMNADYANDKQVLNDRIEELVARGISKDEIIATLLTMICKHLGCSLREPIPGQGRLWYEQFKTDISLGVDYLPINQLMVQYGEKKKRNDKTRNTNGD